MPVVIDLDIESLARCDMLISTLKNSLHILKLIVLSIDVPYAFTLRRHLRSLELIHSCKVTLKI